MAWALLVIGLAAKARVDLFINLVGVRMSSSPERLRRARLYEDAGALSFLRAAGPARLAIELNPTGRSADILITSPIARRIDIVVAVEDRSYSGHQRYQAIV